MKTKITAPALVLAVAIAATVGPASRFGSARIIPMPIEGDPIPGVDVSIEQLPPVGRIIARGRTNHNGIVRFTNIPVGEITVHVSWPLTSNNYNTMRTNTAGITIGGESFGTIPFSKQAPGQLLINVPGTAPQTIVVKAVKGGQPPTMITCPSASNVTVQGPTGWIPYNPNAFLEIRTSAGKTGVICIYGITGQDVKVRVGKLCPTGTTATITGANTASCQ
jgi:hypothetical protein